MEFINFLDAQWIIVIIRRIFFDDFLILTPADALPFLASSS